MSKFKDFDQLTQRGKFRNVKAKYNAWKTRWDEGKNWGIVGGTGDKALPPTVLEEVLEHGKATFARDSARTIEGLGELIESMSEILDGDIILEEHKKDLELDIEQMERVLKTKKWNPRNIPFHTVIDFTLGDKGEKPTIVRGKRYGHYRTPAYNKYVKWAMKNKENFKGKLAPTKAKWSNKTMGQAEPPLWQAISGESEYGILRIAREALKATDGVTIGDDSIIRVHKRGTKYALQLAQLKSVQERVQQALQNSNIYPGGKSKQVAPVKDRLNAEFSGHTYAVAPDEIDLLNFVQGWNEVVGTENLKSIKLEFPPNNKALNAVIRAVLGDEINTLETPMSRAGRKTGITLKAVKPQSWEEILGA